ncbi:hypothetical protein MJO29_005610 [Puccinia striiformis f. sp. tritici]|nr:hypothetical protein Pst134EB_010813 [Puccinia striiformis f. sp. tritici]KAI7960542.1 hypothetical protein MJO29_005610 [Puccinia striiformis f. sp. tritici]KAI9612006.1 hypothetical protein H4Q26_008096 [Puccinia striiformis f. sp. tritici PST-130]
MQISSVVIFGFFLLEGVLGNPISPHGVTKHRRDREAWSKFTNQKSMTLNTTPGKLPMVIAPISSLLTQVYDI